VFLLLRKLDGQYDDEATKVCTFYKVQDDRLPAVLLLDPITGQMLDMMSGTIKPDEFTHFISKYTNSKPSEQSKPKIVLPKTATLTQGSEAEQAAMPAGSEQDKELDGEPVDGEKMCKLRVRFPDSNVVTKEFGCQRSVQALRVLQISSA
jgi:hypothetical protein